MNHRSAIAAVVAAGLLTLTPAAANAEAGRPMHLGPGEVVKVVKRFLESYVGPTVSNDFDPAARLSIRVWDCSTNDNRGTCHGTVIAGDVKCTGSFRVIEFPKKYKAFPVRMECSTPLGRYTQ